MSSTLRRTPLYDRHLAAGAKLVDFAGWEMPVEYEAGLRAEHLAVREACGIFDVSHMGEIETRGAGALTLLQRLISNDIAAIPLEGELGGAQYGLLCREDGGVLDDLFTYRLGEDRYLTVTNAGNHEHDLARFQAHAEGAKAGGTVADGVEAEWIGEKRADGGGSSEVEVLDKREQIAMLAVQGPAARGIVGGLSSLPLPPRMRAATRSIAGADVLVCGTGYTGEDGVELLCDPSDAPRLWDRLLAAGAQPAGLGARDTLRLEACFHLYGNDLSARRNPIEAGLGWCCKEQTGFIGCEAVKAMRRLGPPEKLVAFAIEARGIARAGNAVIGGGVVTSGTLSPSLGVGVGLAYVPSQRAKVGERLEIDVRGKIRDAIVRPKPLYQKAPPQK